MNSLPEPIINNIYKYKHQLEFKNVMDELTDNNIDTMYLTRQAMIRYLKRSSNDIELVMLNNNNRMSVCDYLKMLCRSRNKIFN